MRLLPGLLFLYFFSVTVINGQGIKPTIVGQKDLSTIQGQPITIQLSDLYVQEEEEKDPQDKEEDKKDDDDQSTGSDDEDSGNNGDGTGEGEDNDGAGNGNGGDGEEDDEDESDGGGGDNDGNEGSGNGNGDDDKKDEDDKDDDKGEDKDDDKDKDDDDKDKDKDDDKDKDKDDDKDKDKDKDEDKDKEKKDDKDKGKGNRTLSYPQGYVLEVFDGPDYTVNGTTVTPAPNFTGILKVDVRVKNQHYPSPKFALRITVRPDAEVVNTPPRITGQSGLKIPEGEALTLKFSHLVVHDPDNAYPDDFSLHVSEGEHHTVSEHTIRPAPGFRGILSVPVAVHDGTVSSDPFNVQIQVVAKDRLEIIGQEPLEIPEDSAIIVDLSDLHVNDPAGGYPNAFTLKMNDGENYKIVNGHVTPDLNFSGNLTVPVTIARAGTTSAPFPMLVVVTAVNDAPELENIDTMPLNLTGPGPWPLFATVEVHDVDDDDLLFAEIGFGAGTYHRGTDEIQYEPSAGIRGVFDTESGILFLIGKANKATYQTLIRSLRYNLRHTGDSVDGGVERNVYIKVNDGKTTSPVYERQLIMGSGIQVEIPSAFTPNNDHANDTWQITLQQSVEQLTTYIRVYDKKGNLVFESNDITNEWDGHHNGRPLPADIYFFTIDMDLLNRKVNYKGIVSILR